jgi:predicted O-methyltransferase YrrM
MNITTFLNSRGYYNFEGYSQQVSQQVEDLNNIVKNINKPIVKNINEHIVNVMEIGFNAGHSAEILLSNSNVKLTSFDLGRHHYVLSAKEYIDMHYPNRHTLILGDSTITIPNYIKNNKDTKFDFIFIDGGHDYAIAKADMENCYHLAHKDTIVALDDTIFTKGWEQDYTVGPTQTWLEHIQQNKIVELNRKDYAPGRGMSWGRYTY